MVLSKNTSFSIELPLAYPGDRTILLAASELKSLCHARFQGTGGSKETKVRLSIDRKLGGYTVSALEDTIHFVGSSPVEVLYSIYDFAEKYLDFCFFEPGRDIVASASPEREIPSGNLLGLIKPLLQRRGLIQEFPFSDESFLIADWMVKNRLNYLMVWMKFYDLATPEMREAFLLRGIEIESGHHNFSSWIPGEKYAAGHPEFFASIGGRRISPSPSKSTLLLSEQLCTTNPELRREIARRMISYTRDHPELKTISLMPNDGFGWCECDECSKFYDKSAKGDTYSVSKHVYKAGRIYQDLICEVAKDLHKQNPDLTLTFCAYVNYSSPEPGFRIPEKAAVHFAPYWRCVNHAIHDPSCWLNSAYRKDLEAWIAAKDGGEVNVYEYLMGINLYVSLPLVFHKSIFDEVREHARIGVDGFLTQFHLTNWTAYGMNYYMMAKALYGADQESELAMLFRKLFGSTAPAAKMFYDKLLAIQKSSGPCLVTYPRALFNRTNVEDYRQVHQMAVDLAEGTSSDFVRRLPLWTGYLLKFKQLFDQYQAGLAVKNDVVHFKNWCRPLQAERVLVHGKLEWLLDAWIQCFDTGAEWMHFNLGWEDEYIRLHDSLLCEPPKN